MMYKLRFPIFILIMMMSIGCYVFDVRPHLNARKTFQEKMKNVMQNIEIVRQDKSRVEKNKGEEVSFDRDQSVFTLRFSTQLVSLLNQTGLLILSAKYQAPFEKNNIFMQSVELKLLGDPEQIRHFISQLSEQKIVFVIDRFSYHADDRGRYQFDLSLVGVGIIQPELNHAALQKSPIQKLPLCYLSQPVLLQDPFLEKKIRDASINQLRLFGIVGNKNSRRALIGVSNEIQTDVGEGDVIGHEHAMVQQINPSDLILVLSDHTQLKLTLND